MSKPILTEKSCNKCGEIFQNTLEYFRVGGPGKVGATCRKCHAATKKAWRKNNPDKVAAEKKRSHERHRETDNARVMRWVDANRDRKHEQDRQYRLDHLEERRAYELQWQRDNPEKVRARVRTYERRNPHIRAVIHQNRRARENALPATLTHQDWKRALEYFEYRCAVCGRPNGLWHKLAQDHWIPVSDVNCPGTVPANIIPLCHGDGGCNNSKSNTDPLEWLTRRFGEAKAKKVYRRIQDYFEWLKNS